MAVDLRALAGPTDGIGSYTLEMMRALAKRGGARYLGLAHRELGRADELRAAGVEVETQPSRLGLWWQQWKLPRRLAQPDVDLFWSPLNTLPTQLPKPAVVTVHDLTPVLFPESHTLKLKASVLPFLRRSLDTARVVVADSESTANDLRRYRPACADRLRVVYPGVSSVYAPASESEIEATREELGCSNGYILFVGTLEPRKNVELVIEAWEDMRNSSTGAPPLVLAGGPGWRSEQLLRRIEELSGAGLHYLGHVESQRLVRVYQAASVFAYPSFYEGFGLPPLEAMACGVPTVVSNRSSLPEVAGEAALQVDPTDSEELAVVIQRILADAALARDLGVRGVERAAELTWERAATAMESLFLDSLQ